MPLRDMQLGTPRVANLTLCRTSSSILTQPQKGDLHPHSRVGTPFHRARLGPILLLPTVPYLRGAASLSRYRPGARSSLLCQLVMSKAEGEKNQTQKRCAQWFPRVSLAMLKFKGQLTILQESENPSVLLTYNPSLGSTCMAPVGRAWEETLEPSLG